ncbi:MAG: hypothetical protein AAFZ65_08755 [Planctomycetota bacterium]
MQPIDTVLWATAALALAGTAWSVGIRFLGAGRLGTVLGRSAGSQRARWAVAGLILAGAGALFATEADARPSALVALVAAFVFNLLRPGFGDRLCGDEGLRRGWVVRTFSELEEWRLIGEHLRFKLFGEWEAVPLDPEHHADLRARLVAVASDRESTFGHGLEHPDRRETIKA